MTPTADPPAPRPRRWWRRVLGLRGLMALVLLIAVGMGSCLSCARLHREAIVTIEAAGGELSFVDRHPQARGWWAWLYRRTGVEMFREVEFVQVFPRRAQSSGTGAPPGPRPSTDAAIEAMARLGPIGVVVLHEFEPSASNLARLARIPITQLYLNTESGWADDALDALSRLRGIRGLAVATTEPRLPRGIFRAVGELTQLKMLCLAHQDAHLGPLDLAPLGRLRNLEDLSLSWAEVEAGRLGALASMTHLVRLELERARPDDEVLRRLAARCPGLEVLAVDGSALTDRGVEGLVGLPRLWQLTLLGRPGRLTDAGLAALGRAAKLQMLKVSCGRFGPAGLDALRGLPLKDLTLAEVGPGSEAAIGRLVAGKSFSNLSLSGPGVTDAALPRLAGTTFQRFGSLNLSRSAVTDAGVPALAALPVARLDLSATALTDAGLATLAAGAAARELVARGTKITPAGIAAYEAMRPGQGRFEGSPDDD